MSFGIKPTPRLPPELLDRIVDFADYLTAKSCLRVSRHFHECALRNIYQECNVLLTDTDDNLKGAYQHFFTDKSRPRLGDTGRFVTSLTLNFVDGRPYHNAPINEGSLLPLLKSFREMPRLEHLSLQGGSTHRYPRIKTDWTLVPRSIQTALLSILGAISTLHVGEVDHFPIHSLCDNTRLRDLKIYDCSGLSAMPAVAEVATMTIPNLKHLSTGTTLPFPKGFILPTLRSIATSNYSRDDIVISWREIKVACQSLESIHVYDLEGYLDSPDTPNSYMHPFIPTDLRLNMFPNLVSLFYEYEGQAWAGRPNDAPLLKDVLGYFEVSEAVPRLKTIKLALTIDESDSVPDDLWINKKDMLANDSSWSSLNRMLTSGNFPRLQRLDIDLKLNNSLVEKIDWEIVHAAIQSRDRIDRCYSDSEGENRTMILSHLINLQAGLVFVSVRIFTNY